MLQAWVIWNLCNLENKIISVERIFQYMSIPSEPPLTTDSESITLDCKWPSEGEIILNDLQVLSQFHLFTALIRYFNTNELLNTGSICSSHAFCSEGCHMHIYGRYEDWHCRKNRQWKIYSNSDTLPYHRSYCWSNIHRQH